MSSPLPPDDGTRMDNWLVMVDPDWGGSGDQPPPTHVIVGGWPLDEQDEPGPFEPNPQFVPATPGTPTDPIDAVLRLIGQGREVVDDLIPAVLDTIVEIAVGDDDSVLVGPAPDGEPCVVIATAPLHKAQIRVPAWRRLPGSALAGVVPDGVDILLNPGGPATMRLSTRALADAAGQPVRP